MILDHDILLQTNQLLLHSNEILSTSSHWIQLTVQGIADSVVSTPKEAVTIVCPEYGQPGWGPFCFLNGNPIFNSFDQFQAFVQNSVVSLRDTLHDAGISNAYGLSIILFTLLVRIMLFPVTYQQLASTEKTKALIPQINEIKEKYPDKTLQNQLVALLYQETNVNPLAGCLPAILQIPVFIALYRSFFNLASVKRLSEPFLWLPDLEGPGNYNINAYISIYDVSF